MVYVSKNEMPEETNWIERMILIAYLNSIFWFPIVFAIHFSFHSQ